MSVTGPDPQPGAPYVHGTDPGEQRRLTLLNDLINRNSLAALALKGGERVLDMGAGLGQLTRDMARAAGVPALGIERSGDQIAEGLRQARQAGEENLIELRQGDGAAPPLRREEWGSFDVAHARFILEHVADPPAVVAQMVRAVRPGGRIVLEDDDHDVLRMWPEPARLSRLWQAYIRLYERLGNDAFIGRKLVGLLHQAGARPVRNHWLWFGACAGESAFIPLMDNLAGILRGARDRMLGFALVSQVEFDAGLDELRDWTRRPDAALWFAVCWAEGVKPGP